MAFAIVFAVPVLLVLAIIPAMRAYAGHGFVVASYVFGVTTWMLGLLLTLSIWGWFAVIVGLFFMGVGIVPIALLATATHGMWPEMWQLLLALVLTFCSRVGGLFLLGKAEGRRNRLAADNANIVLPPSR
jgi:hypothetical protein